MSGLWWSLDRRFIGDGSNAQDAAVQDVAGRWWSRDGGYRWDGSQWHLVDPVKTPPLAWSKSTAKLESTTPGGWTDLTFGLWEEPAPDIRGESYYQNVLITLFGPPSREGHHQLVEVHLTREPDNPHDSSAVKALIANHQIGHLAREWAAILGPKMDAQGIVSIVVPGLVLGAFDQGPNYGVRIWGRRIVSVLRAEPVGTP
jgi:HIRAN domain